MTRGSSLLLFSAFALGCSGEPDRGRASPDTEGRTAVLVQQVTIGGEIEAAPEYTFSSIKDILVDDDGVIWVLDGPLFSEEPLLRQYDREGVYIRQVGRRGEGPGEHEDPYAMALLPDGRVAVRDYTLADRVTLYRPDGELDATLALPAPIRWTHGAADGIRVDFEGVLWLPTRGRPGPNRPPPESHRIRLDGSSLEPVPFPPTPDVERDRVSDTTRLPSGATSVRGVAVPYQPLGLSTWSPEGTFAVFRTDRYRIEVLPPPGPAASGDPWGRTEGAPPPLRVVERNVPPVPVGDAERAALRSDLAARIAELPGGAGINVPEIPMNKPPLRSARFADDGRLLVLVSAASVLEDGSWTEPRTYDLFDRGGSFVGRIVPPVPLGRVYLKGNHLWGVYRDDLGIESVRGYRIEWP